MISKARFAGFWQQASLQVRELAYWPAGVEQACCWLALPELLGAHRLSAHNDLLPRRHGQVLRGSVQRGSTIANVRLGNLSVVISRVGAVLLCLCTGDLPLW